MKGASRVLGIVGDPIAQVRSPEMFTATFRQRGHNALMIPVHLLPGDFDAGVAGLLAMRNLDGLIFTIPYKQRAVELAASLGPNAEAAGAINALARQADGSLRGEIFDGIGCVAGLGKNGVALAGRRVALLGAGGAGGAIGVAVALEGPQSLTIHDPDRIRAEALRTRIARVAPTVFVELRPPQLEALDVLLNASPIGMLDDERMPIAATELPPELVVFDAIVKPERTPLLRLAERCGCKIVFGRDMMWGQVEKMADYFGFPAPGSEA